jgi:hypothetical protein
MSDVGLILPPGISLPPHIQPVEQPDEDDDNDTKAGALPVPTGWKLLCVVPEVSSQPLAKEWLNVMPASSVMPIYRYSLLQS